MSRAFSDFAAWVHGQYFDEFTPMTEISIGTDGRPQFSPRRYCKLLRRCGFSARVMRGEGQSFLQALIPVDVEPELNKLVEAEA